MLDGAWCGLSNARAARDLLRMVSRSSWLADGVISLRY